MTESYAAVLYFKDSTQEEVVDCFTRWKSEGCTSPFIVLTKRDSLWDRIKALEIGIDHYFIQPFSYTSLIHTITLYEAKKHLQERNTVKTRHFELDIMARMVYFQGALMGLTRTEFDLLALLIRRRGTVLSRVQIWEEIWGYRDYGLANTIDVHIARLRRKLPKEFQSLIITIYGVGYRMHELA